jgi:hypothetical protein
MACGGGAANATADSAAVVAARLEVDSGAFTDGDERVSWRRSPSAATS